VSEITDDDLISRITIVTSRLGAGDGADHGPARAAGAGAQGDRPHRARAPCRARAGAGKGAGTGEHRIEALRLAEVYRARVVDATVASFVFEVTGGSEKLDKFVELMRDLGLVEVARTASGIVAIARGAEAA
jgi:acetolactate synthase-1/3 small subunit